MMNFCKLLMKSYALTSLIFLLGIVRGTAGDKVLEYVDKVYEPNIKTPFFIKAGSNVDNVPHPAVVSIHDPRPLVLKFDEIDTDNADYYFATILHCNYEWQPSKLSELQFLHEYNEFSIDEYDFSVGTKVPYTHFTFPIPRVKVPGNYLLVVYRGQDRKDIVISRRFVVFDQRVKILSEVGLSTGTAQRRVNQQIDFTLDYNGISVPNPYLDIKVVIRQNQRWDNAIDDLQPSMVKEDIRQIDYRFFDFESNFKGGNEFRFFDIRSMHFGGRNVERFTISDTQIDAYLFADRSRGSQPYTFIDDLNGGFTIENLERSAHNTESEYIKVHFYLQSEQSIGDDVFVAGAFTGWSYDEVYRMNYLKASKMYAKSLLLKQGLYDFVYYTPTLSDPYFFEGSHAETTNQYEIIIYLEDAMMGTDVVIGYTSF